MGGQTNNSTEIVPLDLHKSASLKRRANAVLHRSFITSKRQENGIMPQEVIFYLFLLLISEKETKTVSCLFSCCAFFWKTYIEVKNILKKEKKSEIFQNRPLNIRFEILEKFKTVKAERIVVMEKETTISQAIQLFNKSAQTDALKILINGGVVKNSANSVAKFLLNPDHSTKINKKCVAQYIGDQANNKVLQAYLRQFDFNKIHITDAIRQFIDGIDVPTAEVLKNLMKEFAKFYLTQNTDTEVAFECRKAGADRVADLAANIFKIRFLENGEPKQKPLLLSQFSSLQGCSAFSKEFLKNIFERVHHIGLLIDRNGKLLTVVRTGWLNKEGQDLLKRYKKRWFLLADNTLYYYKSPGDPHPIGVLFLTDVKVTKIKSAVWKLESTKQQILSTSKTTSASSKQRARENFVLQAESENEAKGWIRDIEDNTEFADLQAPYPTLRRRSTKVGKSGSSKSPPSNAPPASRSPVQKGTGVGHLNNNSNSGTPANKLGSSGALIPYFGIPLEEICNREGVSVPILVQKAVEYLEAKALKDEGILRLSGSLLEMEDIKAEISRGVISFEGHDTNAVAGVFKFFFRELPELIPTEINNGAKVVLNFAIEPQDLIEEMKNIISSLPKCHYETFKILVGFMNKIRDNQQYNKMTMDNILRVMIPTLNCLPSIVSVAMENFDFIFSEVLTSSGNSNNNNNNHKRKGAQRNNSSNSSNEKLPERPQSPTSEPTSPRTDEDSPSAYTSATNNATSSTSPQVPLQNTTNNTAATTPNVTSGIHSVKHVRPRNLAANRVHTVGPKTSSSSFFVEKPSRPALGSSASMSDISSTRTGPKPPDLATSLEVLPQQISDFEGEDIVLKNKD